MIFFSLMMLFFAVQEQLSDRLGLHFECFKPDFESIYHNHVITLDCLRMRMNSSTGKFGHVGLSILQLYHSRIIAEDVVYRCQNLSMRIKKYRTDDDPLVKKINTLVVRAKTVERMYRGCYEFQMSY